jgi:hypothetical protein
MINKEIPFPIPLCNLFSNHIAKIVPVTRITTDENKNSNELKPNKMHY